MTGARGADSKLARRANVYVSERCGASGGPAVDGAGGDVGGGDGAAAGRRRGGDAVSRVGDRSAAFARSVGGAVLTPFESESDTFRDTVALALCLLNERFGGESSSRRRFPNRLIFRRGVERRARDRARGDVDASAVRRRGALCAR